MRFPKSTLRKFVLIALITGELLIPGMALAGAQGTMFSLSGMALTNSSKQGGQGPSGSTVLSQLELVYHGPWWGLGALTQIDKQGSNETDIGYGPKLELHKSVFYVEAGWEFALTRSFTDRSIAKQTGSAWVLGAGVRYPLGSSEDDGEGGGKGLFLQFSYKYRIQTIKKQDQVPLSDPITQKDGYPLFGIGIGMVF